MHFVGCLILLCALKKSLIEPFREVEQIPDPVQAEVLSSAALLRPRQYTQR